MITIASYIIIFLTQALSLTFIPISLVGEILKKLKIPLQIGIFIGGLLTWFFINLIWLKVYNHNLPLLAFVLSFSFQFIHGNLSNKELTETSKQMIVAEMWSILLIALYVLVLKEFNWI